MTAAAIPSGAPPIRAKRVLPGLTLSLGTTMSGISGSWGWIGRGWKPIRSRWAATGPRMRRWASVLAPGFACDEIVPAIERLLRAYLALRRDPSETFLDAYRRLGLTPFADTLYGPRDKADAA